MNKYEFLEKLQKKLRGLPEREVGERINFYGEMIDDRIEEGLSEEEAVLAVGTVEEVAYQITEEIQLLNAPKEKARTKKFKTWEIVLLILGSPLWLSLMITGFALGVTFYALVWTVNLCLWAIEVPFLIFEYISKGLFIACKKTTEASWYLTKKGGMLVKKFFCGKENENEIGEN